MVSRCNGYSPEKMKNEHLIVIGICLLFSVTPCIAEKSYFDMELSELMAVEVTGATLTEKSFLEVPSAVTVFTRKEIQELAIDYLYELVNFVPGFQFNRNSDSPSGYTFSARGRRNSSENREVLLLVDGRRFIDARTSGVDGSLPYFPVEQIERVEVIRGPGSTLYGSGAFNGVINVVTHREGGEVSLSAGSQNRKAVTLHMSSEKNDINFHAFAKLYSDEGQEFNLTDVYRPDGLVSQDSKKIYNVDLQLSYKNSRFNYAYHKALSDDFYIASLLDNQFNQYGQLFHQLSFQQHWQYNDVRSELTVEASESDQSINFTLLPEGALFNASIPQSTDPLRLKGSLAGETYRMVWFSDWSIKPEVSLQLGAEWLTQKETAARGYNNYSLYDLVTENYPVAYFGDFDEYTLAGFEEARTTQAVFSQYIRPLTDNLELTLGLRYDKVENIKSHFSPRLAMVWQRYEGHAFKLIYGEAFRAPSLSELGIRNNPVLLGNENLQHEIVKTTDLIWIWRWANNSLSTGVFHTLYESPIITGAIGNTRTYINGDRDESAGIEIEWNYELRRNWFLRAGLTSLQTLPESALREADTLATLINNIQWSSWNLNVAAIYHGERKFFTRSGNQESLSSYSYVNAKLTKSFDHLNISLQLKNALDAEIVTPSQGFDLDQGVPFRGREWQLEFQKIL